MTRFKLIIFFNYFFLVFTNCFVAGMEGWQEEIDSRSEDLRERFLDSTASKICRIFDKIEQRAYSLAELEAFWDVMGIAAFGQQYVAAANFSIRNFQRPDAFDFINNLIKKFGDNAQNIETFESGIPSQSGVKLNADNITECIKKRTQLSSFISVFRHRNFSEALELKIQLTTLKAKFEVLELINFSGSQEGLDKIFQDALDELEGLKQKLHALTLNPATGVSLFGIRWKESDPDYVEEKPVENTTSHTAFYAAGGVVCLALASGGYGLCKHLKNKKSKNEKQLRKEEDYAEDTGANIEKNTAEDSQIISDPNNTRDGLDPVSN